MRNPQHWLHAALCACRRRREALCALRVLFAAVAVALVLAPGVGGTDVSNVLSDAQDDTSKQRLQERTKNLSMAKDFRRRADSTSCTAEKDALLQKAQTFFQKVKLCITENLNVRRFC